MMRFAGRKFGPEVQDAWLDFNQNDMPPEFDDLAGEQQIFFPYFLFDWNPDAPPLRRGKRPAPGAVVAAFLRDKGHRLSELERMIAELTLREPLSFYEVVECRPGQGMTLRDVLIGGESKVEEHKGSTFARVGDILYGQLCPLPEVTTLSRMAPLAIPPDRKAEIVKLRAWMRKKIARLNRNLAAEDLIRYREEIRTVYLDIRDAQRTPPRLTNTDGEPLLLHTLTFRVGSAQLAFDALFPLSLAESREDLLDDARIDDDGTLLEAEIPWMVPGNKMHATWENTILGHIRISGRTLTVEVNSAARAERIRREIEKRLGSYALHQGTQTQSPQEMLAAARARHGGEGEKEEDPPVSPEVREAQEEFVRQHTEAWVHTKLPVLDGRTPMQAVKNPDGREIVEGLLTEWDRRNNPGAQDVRRIRELLRL
ncbi:MAG: hypothetical protein ACLGXA_24820 [Acidobacteriota bacterium]